MTITLPRFALAVSIACFAIGLLVEQTSIAGDVLAWMLGGLLTLAISFWR